MDTVRSARNKLAFTIIDAAKHSGLSITDWKKIERGLVNPTTEQVKKISNTLGIPIDALLINNRNNQNKVVGEGYVTHEDNQVYILEPKTSPNLNKLNVVDLFCGAGGLSHGFHDHADFNVSLGLDLLGDRVETFYANNPNSFAVCGDLRKFSFHKILERVEKVDVLLGGPPCQGFSSIRPFRNLTESDSRNSLPEQYLLAVSNLQPEWVIFENVVGILSTKQGSVFNQVLEGVSELGYFVEYKVINAVELGVPQNRERVFIVGRRSNKKFSWMKPRYLTNGRSMASNKFPTLDRLPLFDDLKPSLTVSDAISDLPRIGAGETCSVYSQTPRTEYQKFVRGNCSKLTLHIATRHSEKMMEIVRLSGKNRNALPEHLTSSGFSSSYSRLDYDEPSTTLTVNFVHPSSNRCIHPVQDRALTPREGARLQGFKDDFIFRGTRSNIARQIGNAVPPIISSELAKLIISNS